MRKQLSAATLIVLLAAGTAPAWWVKGHGTIAEAAASCLPETMPRFFRAGGKALADGAGDPDRWKNPSATFLKSAISPDHYLDLEHLQGRELPADRYQALALLVELKQKPDTTGMLPYALMENYERLCCAFRDCKEPDNPYIQAKCLVTPATLPTTRATAPCRCTRRDYDGKRTADGTTIQKGIHAKIDGFPEKNGLTASRGNGPRPGGQGNRRHLGLCEEDFLESHTHVARCAELDAAGEFDKPTARSREFILQRCRVGTQFTIDLWLQRLAAKRQVFATLLALEKIETLKRAAGFMPAALRFPADIIPAARLGGIAYFAENIKSTHTR